MKDDATPQIEGIKLLYDFLKHLITLCTGSVVLLTAFLPKLPEKTEWGWLARLSLIGFIISMIACLIAAAVIVLRAEEGHFDHTQSTEAKIETTSFYVGALAFLLSTIALIAFACRNIPI